MPKRVGYLYEKMVDKDLIRLAIKRGSKGKKERWDVKDVLADVESHVDKLYAILASGTFVPTVPKEKTIYDTCGQKHRTIYVVPFFPDGVMHQIMAMVLEPVLMRGMYHWSCASIPRRGASRAAKYVRRVIRDDVKGTKYVCKMDVKQYYPSIDHKRLIWALARKVKDKRFLKLVYDVLETCPKGLAIGYFICQWLANFYLEPLDRYILEIPGVKYMVRYMDDIVLFGPNKKHLKKARLLIDRFMTERLGLRMKQNWQVFPLRSRMLDFVGFRFGRNHTILRKRNFLRYTRQCRKVIKRLAAGRRIPFQMAAGLLSRAGQLKHCNSLMIRQKYIDQIGVKLLKEVVRYESKRRCCATGCIPRGVAA